MFADFKPDTHGEQLYLFFKIICQLLIMCNESLRVVIRGFALSTQNTGYAGALQYGRLTGFVILQRAFGTAGCEKIKKPGDDLLFHRKAVPSALEGLTSVFGMGTGVAPPQ